MTERQECLSVLPRIGLRQALALERAYAKLAPRDSLLSLLRQHIAILRQRRGRHG